MTRTVERKPKGHRWPLRVVDCPSCGWRHYPKPEQNGGPAVEWLTASTCSACGRKLAWRDNSRNGSRRVDELRRELDLKGY